MVYPSVIIELFCGRENSALMSWVRTRVGPSGWTLRFERLSELRLNQFTSVHYVTRVFRYNSLFRARDVVCARNLVGKTQMNC
jgi:hypothetical protein